MQELIWGGSIAIASGVSKAANIKKSVALIGDGGFFHSGLNGLMNAVWNKSIGTVIICYNHVFSCTGGQVQAGDGLTIRGEKSKKIEFDTLCRAIGVEYITKVNPYQIRDVKKVLRREIYRPELSVIISDAPCVKYLSNNEFESRFKVDDSKCKGCKRCFNYECSAMEFVQGKAFINPETCVGCGVCKQICWRGAIDVL
jgi:indolepyruvate ferredoxin oxidoreductase, alpha subunit